MCTFQWRILREGHTLPPLCRWGRCCTEAPALPASSSSPERKPRAGAGGFGYPPRQWEPSPPECPICKKKKPYKIGDLLGMVWPRPRSIPAGHRSWIQLTSVDTEVFAARGGSLGVVAQHRFDAPGHPLVPQSSQQPTSVMSGVGAQASLGGQSPRARATAQGGHPSRDRAGMRVARPASTPWVRDTAASSLPRGEGCGPDPPPPLSELLI